MENAYDKLVQMCGQEVLLVDISDISTVKGKLIIPDEKSFAVGRSVKPDEKFFIVEYINGGKVFRDVDVESIVGNVILGKFKPIYML